MIKLPNIIHIKTPSSEGNVLTIKDLKSLLKRLNFFLPAGDPILVAYARVHARWLELLVICKGGIKLLLCAFEVSLFLFQRLRLVLFLLGLVLDVLGFLCLIDLRIGHEFIILFLPLFLRSLRLSLKACEV